MSVEEEVSESYEIGKHGNRPRDWTIKIAVSQFSYDEYKIAAYPCLSYEIQK